MIKFISALALAAFAIGAQAAAHAGKADAAKPAASAAKKADMKKEEAKPAKKEEAKK